ncbi:gamma-glutamyltransferase [Alteriqipengyuania lutimaris]|uniref:Glutathione hydrolase proenzyme n=1 Tax=Alteriqipengyuania lutimaris TaxID=1538146 RepID=A0A395LIP9_9SPHN|nr:gamma-glutamyltransferase [Alteriqipengyuania lutimaris]
MLFRTTASIAAALSLAACATAPEADAPPAPVAALPPSAGVVASADPRATVAGEAMLEKGGNAVDAALATMIALTVVEPQSSGIGGGGFILLGQPDGTVQSYDGRETAPAGATPAWFLDEEGKPLPGREATISGLSVGVPGNIAVAAKLHAEHGKLPWSALFQPAIGLARDGFVLNARLHSSLEGQVERAGHTAQGRALFYTADGSPKPVGTRIVQPELAQTLAQISARGPEVFYGGAFAEGLAATVAAETPREPAMTAADIAAYGAKLRDPVCGDYRGYKVCGMGPPSSGGIAVIGILEQLERFDLAALGPRSVQAWHLFVEAQRLAYADRAIYTGDADFVDVPTQGLIDPAYLASRAELIDPQQRSAQVEPGTPPGAPEPTPAGEAYPESGTTHFVTVGADGTMVSYTSTIEGAFGSGLRFGGFYLNNELTDFDFAPVQDGTLSANRVQGGKRPRSSMSPTVIYDREGEPFLALGAAGGTTIPIQTARAIIGVIDFGLSLEDALALPMVMGFGDRLIVEEGSWLADAKDQWQALGHANVSTSDFLFRTNGALRTPDGWVAAYDPRLDGLAYDRHEDTMLLPSGNLP